MSSSVKEGFLCPICKDDLGDFYRLQAHFDESHSKEDPDILDNIKGLFGKAKKKIDQKINFEKEPIMETIPSYEVNPVSGIRLDNDSDFPLQSKSLFDEFSKHRALKMNRYNTVINKLLLRLEKLTTNIPKDISKRRNHEKSVVDWMDVEGVDRCPECTDAFKIIKRKHHCRLCGSVLCSDCSSFISLELANRLVNPATLSAYQLDIANEEPSPPKTVEKKKFSLRRTSSKESIASMFEMGKRSKEISFRSCPHCYGTLKTRSDQIDSQTSDPPIIVQYYSKLKTLIKEGEILSQNYVIISQSIRSGQTDYSLDEAKNLRIKIVKLAENIGYISKKIQSHGEEDPVNPTTGPALNLQKRIHLSASNFVKDFLIGFEDLPSEKEFQKLIEERALRASKKAEEENNSARLAKLKYERPNDTRKKQPRTFNGPLEQTIPIINHDSGFVLSPNSSIVEVHTETDLIRQQIDIINQYISEAKSAGRQTEVDLLEKNLHELTLEVKKSEENDKELVENYKSFKHIFKSQENNSEELDDYDLAGKNPFL